MPKKTVYQINPNRLIEDLSDFAQAVREDREEDVRKWRKYILSEVGELLGVDFYDEGRRLTRDEN
jgi:hypothetical protein